MGKELVLDLLFPPKCPFCRGLVEIDGMICPSCLKTLPWRSQDQVTVPQAELAIAPFVYEGAVRDALRRFKFNGLSGYARAFAPLLADAIRKSLPYEHLTLSFVPVSKKRLRSRGYDQAQLLAEGVGAMLSLPVEPLLEKIRHNAPQSGIKEASARRGNVIGAYRVRQPEQVAGKSVLLIDDIVTTGATLSECAATLRAAGAKAVYAAAFAHGER